MSTPTCIIIWIFAVIGLHEILFAAVSFLFLAPAEKLCGVIELRGHMENAECLIRSALIRSSGTVYIIDCGADSETRLIAELFSRNLERLVLLSAHDSAFVLGENIIQ